MNTGKVYLVGAGPGDPGLITCKGLDCLRRAEVVIYDQLLDEMLLAEIAEGAEKIFAGKTAGFHAMEQMEINQLLVAKAQSGKNVVRLKGGDPLVFGRGGEEAAVLAENKVPFEIVPGVSSAIAVPAYAGIPVTHRGVASSFMVVAGHESQDKRSGGKYPGKTAAAADTCIYLMGFQNMAEIVQQLIGNGRHPDTPACVIQNGTRPEQRTVRGQLNNIIEKVDKESLGTPAVMIVGDVVNLSEKLRWFDNQPLFGKRILITRARGQAGRLSKLLAAHGARPLELPVISIRESDNREIDKALEKLGGYQWVIFTSSNGVTAFFNRMHYNRLDSRALQGVKIGVIGPATAAALENQGLVPDLRPPIFTSRGLLSGFEKMNITGQRFLLPRADIADHRLSEGLRQQGAIVDEIAAYSTVTEENEDAGLRKILKEEKPDAVTFTSSSTVTGFIAAAGGLENISTEIKIACIGPETVRTAVKSGLKVPIVAQKSTIEGLVEALEGFYLKENS